MRYSELRIGNYVKLRDNGKIVRVESLTKRKIGFHYTKGETMMHYRKYCEIEPILIWDVKDKFKHPYQLSWEDVVNHVELYYYDDIPLTDFHELQNIHYIYTGNEIEIKYEHI